MGQACALWDLSISAAPFVAMDMLPSLSDSTFAATKSSTSGITCLEFFLAYELLGEAIRSVASIRYSASTSTRRTRGGHGVSKTATSSLPAKSGSQAGSSSSSSSAIRGKDDPQRLNSLSLRRDSFSASGTSSLSAGIRAAFVAALSGLQALSGEGDAATGITADSAGLIDADKCQDLALLAILFIGYGFDHLSLYLDPFAIRSSAVAGAAKASKKSDEKKKLKSNKRRSSVDGSSASSSFDQTSIAFVMGLTGRGLANFDRVLGYTDPFHPSFSADIIVPTLDGEAWEYMVSSAFALAPSLVVALGERFAAFHPNITGVVQAMICISVYDDRLLSEPRAVPFLASTAVGDTGSTRGRAMQHTSDRAFARLSRWATCTPDQAVYLLRPSLTFQKDIRRYALRSLAACDPMLLLDLVTQLVQVLRWDTSGEVQSYLVEEAKKSQAFCHRLIWTLRTERFTERKGKPLPTGNAGEVPPAQVDLAKIGTTIEKEVLKGLTKEGQAAFEAEVDLFDQIVGVSGTLLESEEKKRPEVLLDELRKIEKKRAASAASLPRSYLPTNYDCHVESILVDTATPMPSAAKCPFLVVFEVSDRPTSSSTAAIEKEKEVEEKVAVYKKPCIFKMHDDCRQDQLALQVIRAFGRVFKEEKIDAQLFPYNVVSTGPNAGVIEVLMNTRSRDALGKITDGGLFEYFVEKYGHPQSSAFAAARQNLLRSLAPYAVVTYILQIKDRHNGNILVDDDGHIIHIDFGFMYDSSPGGNMKFERSPFKLSREMIMVLGGGSKSTFDECLSLAPFREFCRLTVRCYLAARKHFKELEHLTEIMLSSGLPCFRGDTMKALKQRFCLGTGEKEAALFMSQRISDSFDTFSSRLYDKFQVFDNGIDC
uniref:1-phosphatidylinositol 4-kinase n=1 Tax=Palpitomonas bilix TaxID=652834 RepID=A0A7S3GCJ5_9EUKA